MRDSITPSLFVRYRCWRCPNFIRVVRVEELWDEEASETVEEVVMEVKSPCMQVCPHAKRIRIMRPADILDIYQARRERSTGASQNWGRRSGGHSSSFGGWCQ